MEQGARNQSGKKPESPAFCLFLQLTLTNTTDFSLLRRQVGNYFGPQ